MDIREGIAKILDKNFYRDKWHQPICDIAHTSKFLLDYLKSQGVVQKVEGELIKGPLGDDDYYGYGCGLADGWGQAQQAMLEAGYTQWKEL